MHDPSRVAAAAQPAVIAQSLHGGASLLSPQAAEQKGQCIARSVSRKLCFAIERKPGEMEDGKD